MSSTVPPALPGERLALDGPAGPLTVYVRGQGPALLLVHSVNAAASAAEVRPLFERAAATHTVFAPDLPGFGLSDRSDRPYTPRLMTDALHQTLRAVRARCGVAPVDALAVSLGCEFLARAAVEQPAGIGRLALVSPTGFMGSRAWRGAPGSTRTVPGLLPLLRGPGWGGALFRGLTKPGVIRYFLRRTWGAREIDEALWAYDVQVVRAPGAEFAPLHFLSGGLFSADIHDVYDALAQPVWVAHGDRGDFTDYRGLAAFAHKPNWQVSPLHAGALPHFEPASGYLEAFDRWLADGASAGVSAPRR
ncbi:alpha/beta fold hydrolase [Rubrivivax albus]|uniref:Alpha/beta hydrolase n=1 Tax=Rubrivivax albus TaxID=2499835 RepID=A0A3S3SEN1_9BURK|nr:alpha/beta hydrolase [Rubrivivax albus]RVT53750.1 alpha/beta hydrolase [Rubrivivax albus]